MTIQQEAEELAQACDALTNCLMLVPGLDTVNCARVLRSMATEIASLRDDMNWIERCANHHGQKADVTAAKALSFIQHYPPIRAITKSYADGVVPDTRNPYAEIEDMRARKDAAYLERNQVVAALAKCFPSGIARTAIDGWSEDWHGCVYIDLPTGQASWHFHDSQAYLFSGLPAYTKPWDGHDMDEKYRRVAALESQAAVVHDAAIVAAISESMAGIQKELADAREEIAVSDKLLKARNALLEAIPECPDHGAQCIPHAIDLVKSAVATLQFLRYEWKGGEQWKPLPAAPEAP